MSFYVYVIFYIAFHHFGKINFAKHVKGGKGLGSSQFLLLSLKMMFASKMVRKISKIISSLC